MFIPAQGAVNGSLVPPQPGGLFHGTRVTFKPVALKPAVDRNFKAAKTTEVVCMDVRPLSGQVGLSCGVDTTSGAKEQNDDRLAALDLHELGFMTGIFDGHRGSTCAEFVAKQLPPAVLSAYRARAKRLTGGVAKLTHAEETEVISKSLVEAFESVDSAYQVHARKKELNDGSTAVVGLVVHGFEVPLKALPNAGVAHLWPPRAQEEPTERVPGTVLRAPGGVARLFLAWCGDSRAVLLRGRQGVRCTEDHRPWRKDEKARIQRAGGTVGQDSHGTWRCGPRQDNKLVKELQKKKKDPLASKWFLSTSRAFGDFELKLPDPVVVSTPEVRVVDLVPEDWAAVIASDGVFDTLSDQNVADVVWNAIGVQGKDAVGAAKAVVHAAYSAGSRDNLTAVLMRFGWASAPSANSTAGGAPEVEVPDNLNMFG